MAPSKRRIDHVSGTEDTSAVTKKPNTSTSGSSGAVDIFNTARTALQHEIRRLKDMEEDEGKNAGINTDTYANAATRFLPFVRKLSDMEGAKGTFLAFYLLLFLADNSNHDLLGQYQTTRKPWLGLLTLLSTKPMEYVLWDTCSTDEAIDRALLDLPKDLDETYERCLKRLQKKQEPYALRVIGYVYEARSPLTVEALGEALATNPTTGILLHKQIPPYRFIVECGANLIVFDSERLVVPAHHSVRQFLEGSIAEVLNQLKSNTPQPTLGEICIAHLCWHMELAIEEGAQNPRKIETTSLRMPSISTMSRWKQPHNIISYLRKPSLLWAKKPVLASGSNNAPVVIQRLAIKPKVLYTVGPFQQYARSSWLTFSWPVAHRSELCTRFWELVLQQSADPQLCPWIDGPTRVVQTSDIMWWAIDNSHELLFDMAVHQLSMAKSTVRQSLARLDFNSPLSDYEGLLPLHLAAKQGSLTIFTRVMTMESVDVTSTNSATGWTALHYAVRYGQSEIVKCLLESDPSSMLLRGHDGHSPLCLAIVACSFVTIKAMEAIYGHQAWWGEDVFTLLDALGVNQIDSDLVDHVLWRITSFIEHSHSKVLAWVVKQGDVNLLASAIKAGVSPDTRISSKDLGTGGNLVGDREEIVCEAIFFALEASSPDLALAFIRNGANRKVYTIQNQEYWEPLTLALVRGWISLALLVSDHASNPDRHLMVSFSMSVTGPDVAWFSILATHGGVITSTNFNFLPRKNLVVSEHVMFWQVDTGGVGGTYEMRVNMSSEKSPWPYVGFRLIVGATDTQPTAWRSRPAAKMRRRAEVKIVWRGRQRLFNFELNPYSMQHLQLDHGDITLVDGRPF
ncbi:ankyrin [Aureobasidium pullulans]|nr:ankyrin [Aureobasidium pullulans]